MLITILESFEKNALVTAELSLYSLSILFLLLFLLTSSIFFLMESYVYEIDLKLLLQKT